MQKRLLTEKNLTLEQASSLATAIEMAVLETHESKKTGAPSSMEEEEINHIESQRYVGYCYCCGKKGHMALQCHFRTYKYVS